MNTNENLNSVRRCLDSFELGLLRFVGLYPLPNNVTVILRLVYSTYSVIFMGLTVFLVTCQFLYAISRDDLLESLSSGASETIAFAMVLSKCIIFRLNIHKNIKIITKIEKSWKNICLRDKETHVYRIKRETYKTIRRIKCSSCFIMLVTYVCFVAAAMITDIVSGSEIGTNLPFNVWLPFKLDRRIVSTMIYVVQCLILCYLACSMLALVNLYVAALNLLAAEFKILKLDFANCTDNGIHFGKTEHNELLLLALKRNVGTHQKLIRCQEMNGVLSPIFLLMFMGETFIICLSGYEASLDPFQNLQQTSLMLIAMFHVFIYFWCSHQITFHSREVCEGVYCSQWWKLSRKYRTAVLIVMQRGNRPVEFRASKFCSMSLENFVTLLKTSYSYFALLRTLHAASSSVRK